MISAAVLILASLAAAPEPSPGAVVILGMGGCCAAEAWPEAERELAAELGALGLRVVRLESRAMDPFERRREQDAAVQGLGAQAALRLVRVRRADGERLELWLRDRRPGPIRVRLLPLDAGDPGGASVAALQAVELLRASLPGLAPRAHRPLPVPRLAPRPPARHRDRVGLRAGFGVLGSPGGAGARGAIHAGLDVRLHRAVALEVAADGTVIGPDLRAGLWRATFDVAVVRLLARWMPLRRGRVSAGLGLGAGLLVAWTRGQGASAGLGRLDQATSADLALAAHLALRLHRHLWLKLGATAALALPRVEVRFPDRTRVSFGPFHGAAHLSLETRVP